MFKLIVHEVRSRRAAIAGWGIGLVLFGSIYISLAPELFEQLKSMTNLSVYKLVGLHLESVEGYIASVVLAYISFLLGIYSIISSTATMAGEEDNGTLELLAALPLERWKILTSKAAALCLVVFFILLIAGTGNTAALALMNRNYPVNIKPLSFFTSLIGSLPLLTGFIMMGIFLGSFMPNRRIAATVMSVYFTASYFGEHLSYISGSLETVRYLCLFNYYDTTETIFAEGIRFSDTAVLLAVTAAFYVSALYFFRRRDITVGTWPWKKGKIL